MQKVAHRIVACGGAALTTRIDLYSSMGPEDDEVVPHLFVCLPKVVWVHVYSLLDVPSLFRSQRVCKQWRNLINQPICW